HALSHARGHDAGRHGPPTWGRRSMKILLLVAATSVIALAAPAHGKSVGHSTMPGMTMTAPKAPKAKPATRPAVKPVPKPGARQPNPRKLSPAADSACSPEHAAMGHCMP